MGYHIRTIKKGIFGEASKIREELEEFEDSLEQGNPIMAILELSDLIGSVDGFLQKNYPSITLADLLEMSAATHRAFDDGTRKPSHNEDFDPDNVHSRGLRDRSINRPSTREIRRHVTGTSSLVTFRYVVADDEHNTIRRISVAPDVHQAFVELGYDVVPDDFIPALIDSTTGELKSEHTILCWDGLQITDIKWRIRFAVAEHYDKWLRRHPVTSFYETGENVKRVAALYEKAIEDSVHGQ